MFMGKWVWLTPPINPDLEAPHLVGTIVTAENYGCLEARRERGQPAVRQATVRSCRSAPGVPALTIYDLGLLVDIWKYTLSSGLWTWMGGNQGWDLTGVYGQRGVPSADNRPGARDSPAICYDDVAREFWMLGGLGFLTTTTKGAL
jgi:hypothetical protein